MFAIFIYLGLLFISALAINGWYLITRGRWETTPKGKQFWTGKLFNFWHRLWQTHKVRNVAYEGDEFLKRWHTLSKFFNYDSVLALYGNSAEVAMSAADVNKFIAFALSLNYKVTVRQNGETYLISIFQEVKEYLISDYLKDPLALCITCFSSFYGTLAYLFWYNLLNFLYTTQGHFELDILFGLPLFFKIGLWAVFCLCLSYLLTILNNINEKMSK